MKYVIRLLLVMALAAGGCVKPYDGTKDLPPVSNGASPPLPKWTWVNGSNRVDAKGVYGTLGTAAVGNVPGARNAGISWMDGSGQLWLFGGYGFGSGATVGSLNDLWKWDGTAWTWVSGGNTLNAKGVYGTLGTAAVGNVPGARYFSISWVDGSGQLWLFGGYGYDSAGTLGSLSDLWSFTPSTGLWTWISGSSVVNSVGLFGQKGTAAAGNAPSARYNSISWVDGSGQLWLFGGYGYDSVGSLGNLSDLWKFTPSTGQWTWVSGISVRNGMGLYGTQGIAAAGNAPGARNLSVSWIDGSGQLWLFGGNGYDSAGSLGNLSDLWKFTPSTGQWTWVNGSSTMNAVGVYGALGIAATTNVPGARNASSAWIDGSGQLWLFGGYGYDGGTLEHLNDLWNDFRSEDFDAFEDWHCQPTVEEAFLKEIEA